MVSKLLKLLATAAVIMTLLGHADGAKSFKQTNRAPLSPNGITRGTPTHSGLLNPLYNFQNNQLFPLPDDGPVYDTIEEALAASFSARNVFNQTEYDEHGYQLEVQHAYEISGNKTFDHEYNTQFITNLEQFATVPDVAALRDLLRTRYIDYGDDFEYSKLSVYVDNPMWKLNLAANSCPRTQNYGCRSVYHKLPCWRRWTILGWQYCCPVWPYYAINRVAHCNCCGCAVLSKQGAQCGECHKRYYSYRVLAVCLADGVIPCLVWENKLIPTSCYCQV